MWMTMSHLDGKHLTSNAIYGYKKDPDDYDRWIIDEEAAAVVRRIYHAYHGRKRTDAGSKDFKG